MRLACRQIRVALPLILNRRKEFYGENWAKYRTGKLRGEARPLANWQGFYGLSITAERQKRNVSADMRGAAVADSFL